MNTTNFLNAIICFLALLFFSNTRAYAQCPDQDQEIDIFSQDELDDFLERNPNCTHLNELNIGGTVSDLSGLSSIRSIDWFYIYDCPNLSDLSGFEKVDTVSGNLGFEGFTNLKNLCGLNIKYVGQDLRIDECHSLENLSGLESINTVLDDIRIVDNDNLSSLDGLQSIQVEFLEGIQIQ